MFTKRLENGQIIICSRKKNIFLCQGYSKHRSRIAIGPLNIYMDKTEKGKKYRVFLEEIKEYVPIQDCIRHNGGPKSFVMVKCCICGHDIHSIIQNKYQKCTKCKKIEKLNKNQRRKELKWAKLKERGAI